MANPILTKKRGEQVKSPEQLSDYIKVSNVGVWILLGLVFLLLASVLVWGIVGSLNTTVKATCVAENGKVVCYLTSVDKIDIGDEARMSDISGKVTSISEKPRSAADISGDYDEYTAYQLNLSDWNYTVTIDSESCPDGVCTFYIITDSVRPISFITG